MRKTKRGYPNYDHPTNRHLKDQPLGIAGISAIIITIIVVVLLLTTITIPVKGEIPDNLTPFNDEAYNIVSEYCENSPNGNMTSDLIDTGKISSNYTGWKCDYVEEAQKAGERASKNLEKVQDLMEKMNR